MSALEALVEGLDREVVAALGGSSLLLTVDRTRDEIDEICRLAEIFRRLDREGADLGLFPRQLFYALFFDNSTRTKSSWAGAAARLGGQAVIVDGGSTQVAHGETAEETGAMLGMNAHALGIRHDLILGEGQQFERRARAGLDAYLRAIGDSRVVPVVNLQCDVDHPTQTLADLCWLKERFPDGLAGRTIAVSWAYSPSYAKPLSVPQGLVTLLTRFGAHVRLAFPDGYDLIPDTVEAGFRQASESGGSLALTDSMDDAFEGADAVYPKSWGPYDLMLERVTANREGPPERLRDIERQALARNRQHLDWICDERRMELTREGQALYLHCLPADIGAEVSEGILERYRFDLARQANRKVYVIMAALAASKCHDLPDRLAALAAAAAGAER